MSNYKMANSASDAAIQEEFSEDGRDVINTENQSDVLRETNPGIHENKTDSSACSNSVACQTEWSWLRAYRASMEKLPNHADSTITKTRSDSKLPSTLGADENEEKTSTTVTTETVDYVPRTLESLKSEPWPSRDDEYGIPIYNPSEDELESKKQEKELEDAEICKADDDDGKALEQLLQGICEFCNEAKKPFPSLEDQETKSPEELYCCSKFREHISQVLTETGQPRTKGLQLSKRSEERTKDMSEDGRRKSEPTDVMAEDEGKKLLDGKEAESSEKQDTEGLSVSNPQSSRSEDQNDESSPVFGRAMTTINYQLSSRACMKWSLGLDPDVDWAQRLHGKIDVVEPAQHRLESTRGPYQNLLCQTYDTGSPFLIIFSDGSGNLFYPNGQIAVSIVGSADDGYTYVAQDTDGRLLGVYQPNGKTVTYYPNSSIRICTDEMGGWELDEEGNHRKKWNWNEKHHHVHAPPMYAITCSLSSALTFNISSQHSMILLFQKSRRACRFNVGARAGVSATKRWSLTSQMLDDNEAYMMHIKSRIRDLLLQTSAMLRHPASPRIDSGLTPAILRKRRQKPASRSMRAGVTVLPAVID